MEAALEPMSTPRLQPRQLKDSNVNPKLDALPMTMVETLNTASIRVAGSTSTEPLITSAEPPQPQHHEPTPSDLLKEKADMLGSRQTKFYRTHEAALDANDEALYELKKLTVLSGTWADPARMAIANEAKKIISAALKTYEAAVGFMESTRDFSYSAFHIDKAWRKRSESDLRDIKSALHKSEQARLAERYRTERERIAERTTLCAEVELASSECVGAEQHGLAALHMARTTLTAELDDAEVMLHEEIDRLQAALDKERKERKMEASRRAAALQFERAAKEREMEETKKVLGQLNSERKEHSSNADEIRSLRQGVVELHARKDELQTELAGAAARQVQAVNTMKRHMTSVLEQMEARKQRENDLLSAEIKRLHACIKVALGPSMRAPAGCMVNERDFQKARQDLYFESLKAIGVEPSMLTERVKETISWRAQRQKLGELEQPRMIHRAPPLFFGAAPPPGKKPTSQPSPRESDGRVRPNSARPTFSVSVKGVSR